MRGIISCAPCYNLFGMLDERITGFLFARVRLFEAPPFAFFFPFFFTVAHVPEPTAKSQNHQPGKQKKPNKLICVPFFPLPSSSEAARKDNKQPEAGTWQKEKFH